MTRESLDNIERIQTLRAEIHNLLPHLIDHGLDNTEGLLRIACPEESDAIFAQPDPKDKEKIKHVAIPRQATSISEVLQECALIFESRVATQHPNFFSFIPSTMLPVSWVADLIVSAFNPHVGGSLAGSSCDVVEKSLMSWLVSKIGFPSDEATGLSVSGGSMANFMALTAARDKVIEGAENHHLAVIYVSENNHFSITKAARILGFSESQVRQIPGLCPRSLATSILEDKAAGRIPMAVVATLGSTTTGSIDPISEIADVVSKYDVWLHIDGAYGSSIILSASYAHLASGVEKADSLSWDAHKWLFTSYGCGMLFVRNRKCLARSFSAHSDFLDNGGRLENYEFWDLSLELTRPARAMRLWVILRTLGTKTIGQMIDRGVQLAEEAEAILRDRTHWNIVSPAQMAIVVVRFQPETVPDRELDHLNQKIADVSLERNVVAVQTVHLDKMLALRMCIINPRLTSQNLKKVLDTLDAIAIELSTVKSQLG
ncbi:PLP-dependent transferase [Penicillium brevicompactum]|uniref:PLP-dependent transferase n=1 Tax=Penicillium brevicompactum TaxID=5074 RepID=A0A9W9U8U4_PENBR|nr:PLP-dependent transferase [Penicillium brevicompactum]